MRLVLFIALLESLAVTLWLVRPWLYRQLSATVLQAPIAKITMPLGNSPLYTTVPRSNNRSHWAFINNWQVAGQSDDRRPAIVTSATLVSGPSAQRALARQNHQASYKEWSRGRHDF
jgi:hypothetical protein